MKRLVVGICALNRRLQDPTANWAAQQGTYLPEVLSYSDYYPFGWEMPGRSATLAAAPNGEKYRFGFNGQEEDPEFWDGAVSFKYRVEDARVGRFFSVDPLTKNYPWYTPYQVAGNTPIGAIELEGLEPFTLFNSIEDAAKDWGYQFNSISISEDIEYSSSIYEVLDANNVSLGVMYTPPNQGSLDGSKPSYITTIGLQDDGTRILYAGSIHSHGGWNDDYGKGSYLFSGAHSPAQLEESLKGEGTGDIPGYVKCNKGMREIEASSLTRANSIIELKNELSTLKNPNSPNIIKPMERMLPESLQHFVVTPDGTLQVFDEKTSSISTISTEMPSDPNPDNKGRKNKVGLDTESPIQSTGKTIEGLDVIYPK